LALSSFTRTPAGGGRRGAVHACWVLDRSLLPRNAAVPCSAAEHVRDATHALAYQEMGTQVCGGRRPSCWPPAPLLLLLLLLHMAPRAACAGARARPPVGAWL